MLKSSLVIAGLALTMSQASAQNLSDNVSDVSSFTVASSSDYASKEERRDARDARRAAKEAEKAAEKEARRAERDARRANKQNPPIL